MSREIKNDDDVLQRIVPNGLCVGCGMCAGVLPDVLRMGTDPDGSYRPEPVGPAPAGWGAQSLKVCPFADNADDEDTLGKALFAGTEGIGYRSETGYCLKCFIAYVTDEDARLTATSGGVITWLAQRLLASGKVDAVACVGPARHGPNLFEFQLVTDPADLARCRKSRYYPVEVSEVIGKIKAFEGKVLFIALPCFIKALRLAINEDAALRERIRCTVGLVCGHLKTKKYSAYLARHCSVAERDIETVDFRRKVPGRPANKYAFAVTPREGGAPTERQVLMSEVWASSWSNNLFMLDACECCDDIIAETADIAVGDAWLPERLGDYRGTSIVVCRTPEMLELLRAGAAEGQLALEEAPIEKMIAAQAGAIRQRREGLQYRLYLCQKKRQWRPKKRVAPDARAGSMLFRWAQLLRIKIKTLSKEAFAAQEPVEGLDLFKSRLRFWTFMNQSINQLRHSPVAVKRRLAALTRRRTQHP
ncbi:MAG: Coenzyme F420 hydrogenase/dehydrogenase, beta subunit C-terminal domain [Phycisphaerales bacterium]|nr:MAG: Coenzyme F420 hydrogenase/dehydrogenase, beta subunit C-terminal domain [Phycisphaerales bacterium]